MIVALSGSILAYIYKDKIIQATVNELNKNIQTKIEVDKIDISIIKNFPQLSLSFSNVIIHESNPKSKNHLANLQRVYLSFSMTDLLRQKYVISHLDLEKGFVSLRIDERGNNNYSIFRFDSTSRDESVKFDLNNINLDSVFVSFENKVSAQEYKILSQHSNARLKSADDIYEIGINGDLLIEDLIFGKRHFFKNKNVTIAGKNSYNHKEKKYIIEPSKLIVENSFFEVKGYYSFKKDINKIDLTINNSKGNIQTLISLLPLEFTTELREYQSSGNVFFESRISGVVNEKTNPKVEVKFGINEASIFHPAYKEKITNVNLTGYFSNGSKHNSSTSLLKLSGVNLLLDNRKVSGNFLMENFDYPNLKIDAQGIIALEALLDFYPIANISNAKGTIDFDFELQGNSKEIKANPNSIRTTGQMTVSDVFFKTEGLSEGIIINTADLLFNNNDLAVSNLTGKFGKSDFIVNGLFQNLISNIAFNKGMVVVEADLLSKYIDVDEFYSFIKSDNDKNKESNKTASNYKVFLECSIGKLKYRRFEPTRISSKVSFHYPWMNMENTQVNIAGGKLTSNTLFKLGEEWKISSNTIFQNIYIDSAFYLCENFDQSFVTDKQIQGRLTGNVKLYLKLDENFNADPQSIQANIEAKISNGRLVNFEPMRKLSRFVEERELEDVRFSELSNTVFIENKTIRIPEMEIHSNVSNISISGSHSFDNFMDYRLAVPLKNFKRSQRDKDEAYGAIEEVNQGQTILHLKLKGNSDDFKISYDTQKTKNKIKEDLKKEKKEFLDVFKKKEDKTNPQLIFKKDSKEPEFFDWDD